MDFYTSISNYYNDIFPLNKMQLPFVISSTNTKGSLLDIGCGTGGLAIALSDSIDSVFAIDTNEKMLDVAIKNTSNPNLKFEVGGMLDIDKLYVKNSFDSALCFGNTVVHLQNLEDIHLFFRKVKQILKPDGKFLFQIINYDNVIDNELKGLPTIENDNIRFERNYNLNKKGLIEFETILTLKNTKEKITNCVELFPIRKQQIIDGLKAAGFIKINAYSSFKKDSYNSNSLPLIFECL